MVLQHLLTLCESIAACHRCLLDIRMRSYPQYFWLLQRLVTLLAANSATTTTKRATTRDYNDRNLPELFDVVYDT